MEPAKIVYLCVIYNLHVAYHKCVKYSSRKYARKWCTDNLKVSKIRLVLVCLAGHDEQLYLI